MTGGVCWRSARRAECSLVRGSLPAIAVPFLLLWLAAPAIAWRISQPPPAAARSGVVG